MTRLANHVEVYPYVMSAFRRSSREPQSAPATASTESHAFDLNIEKVLEHWPVPFALLGVVSSGVLSESRDDICPCSRSVTGYERVLHFRARSVG